MYACTIMHNNGARGVGLWSRPRALQSANKNIFIERSFTHYLVQVINRTTMVVLYDIKMKVVTATRRHHCMFNNFVKVAFL